MNSVFAASVLGRVPLAPGLPGRKLPRHPDRHAQRGETRQHNNFPGKRRTVFLARRLVVCEGKAKARLIAICQLIGEVRPSVSMAQTEAPVCDHPNPLPARWCTIIFWYGSWLTSQALKTHVNAFDTLRKEWNRDKSSATITRIASGFTPDFTCNNQPQGQWTPNREMQVKQQDGRAVELKHVPSPRWADSSDTMVVTFGEIVNGSKTGRTKRQYRTGHNSQWKTLFEGVI